MATLARLWGCAVTGYLSLMPTNKSLGQHWLKDRSILAAIADAADLASEDTVLEIGPGLGTLTSELLRRADEVIAVEYDSELARKLPAQFPGKQLTVINEDILIYDISSLKKGYKVVANVPYYITGKIIDKLVTADNRPETAVLLVQKEVAERVAAGPGAMSLLSLSAQIRYEAELGVKVPREYFTPPPEVDSQVVILRKRPESLVDDTDLKAFWSLAKAGFANRRKKLHSSLSAGLGISKDASRELLSRVDIDSNLRAQDLSISDWVKLAKVL